MLFRSAVAFDLKFKMSVPTGGEIKYLVSLLFDNN